jgi:hypothetical protein
LTAGQFSFATNKNKTVSVFGETGKLRGTVAQLVMGTNNAGAGIFRGDDLVISKGASASVCNMEKEVADIFTFKPPDEGMIDDLLQSGMDAGEFLVQSGKQLLVVDPRVSDGVVQNWTMPSKLPEVPCMANAGPDLVVVYFDRTLRVLRGDLCYQEPDDERLICVPGLPAGNQFVNKGKVVEQISAIRVSAQTIVVAIATRYSVLVARVDVDQMSARFYKLSIPKGSQVGLPDVRQANLHTMDDSPERVVAAVLLNNRTLVTYDIPSVVEEQPLEEIVELEPSDELRQVIGYGVNPDDPYHAVVQDDADASRVTHRVYGAVPV